MHPCLDMIVDMIVAISIREQSSAERGKAYMHIMHCHGSGARVGSLEVAKAC